MIKHDNELFISVENNLYPVRSFVEQFELPDSAHKVIDYSRIEAGERMVSVHRTE